jgi:flagellar hook-length control protein FliK
MTPAEISIPGNSKSEGQFGNLAAAVEHSAASRPAGELRLEGAPGTSPPPKTEVYEQISRKMVWSLGQDEEKFRLTLDPPHLGSIYMEIQRDKEQVKATLWAENPNTRQILESNQLSIQKIIEREGFSLESFNVFVEQDLGAFQESRERMGTPEPPPSNPTAQAKGELSGGPPALPLFVRGSGGRVRSIDLII